MKLICSVYDTRAKLWSTPFFSHSAAVAVRDFSAAAKGTGGIAQFPADYQLWSLGEWDDENGLFSLADKTFLARGDDFLEA